jgi:hypothetical protein
MNPNFERAFYKSGFPNLITISENEFLSSLDATVGFFKPRYQEFK